MILKEALNAYIKIYKDRIENESLVFKVGGRCNYGKAFRYYMDRN